MKSCLAFDTTASLVSILPLVKYWWLPLQRLMLNRPRQLTMGLLGLLTHPDSRSWPWRQWPETDSQSMHYASCRCNCTKIPPACSINNSFCKHQLAKLININLIGVTVGWGPPVFQVSLSLLRTWPGDPNGAATVGNTTAKIVDGWSLVEASQASLVVLA